MDVRKLHEAALTLSEKALIERFDATAYITYVTALNALNSCSGADMGNTEIDDTLKEVFEDFKEYYLARRNGEQCADKLKSMVASLKKIIVELYLQSSPRERKIIADILKLECLKGL